MRHRAHVSVRAAHRQTSELHSRLSTAVCSPEDGQSHPEATARSRTKTFGIVPPYSSSQVTRRNASTTVGFGGKPPRDHRGLAGCQPPSAPELRSLRDRSQSCRARGERSDPLMQLGCLETYTKRKGEGREKEQENSA